MFFVMLVSVVMRVVVRVVLLALVEGEGVEQRPRAPVQVDDRDVSVEG